ncbi:reverse transcriptase domain-containing protein [Mesorhizobium sp. KR1-2]|uniref:reverse transcriptase domain-containing protein n=1 Tax=Mesorhizobium sp. KR1-2 TaxID=3156609 RepID=UPI0032B3238A
MDYFEFAARYPDFAIEAKLAKRRMEEVSHAVRQASSRDRRRILLRRLLLEDFSTRLHFAFEGVRRAERLASYEPREISRIATELNVYAPLCEPVETCVIRRGSRSRRIFSFRPRSRARQLLVAEAIKAIHAPFPNQFTVDGGVPAALDAVEQGVRDGFVFGRELDIRDFYPSVQLGHLVSVLHPLPRAVVENTVWMGDAVPLEGPDLFLHGVDADGPLPVRGLRGLPQGSACSPIAAERLVADVIRELPTGVRVITYADNIMLLSETKDGVEQATTALAAELEARSAGSLTLKAPYGEIYDARIETVRFLGREGEVYHKAGETGIDWPPNYFVLNQIFELIEEPSTPSDLLRTQIRRVEKWGRTYPRWMRGAEHRLRLLAQLKAKQAYLSGRVERSVLVGEIERHWRALGSASPLDELLPEPPLGSATSRDDLAGLITQRRARIQSHRLS